MALFGIIPALINSWTTKTENIPTPEEAYVVVSRPLPVTAFVTTLK